MKKFEEALKHLVTARNCIVTGRDRDQLEDHLDKAKEIISQLKETGRPYLLFYDTHDLAQRCLAGDSLKDELQEKINACVEFVGQGKLPTGEYPAVDNSYESAGKTQE